MHLLPNLLSVMSQKYLEISQGGSSPSATEISRHCSSSPPPLRAHHSEASDLEGKAFQIKNSQPRAVGCPDHVMQRFSRFLDTVFSRALGSGFHSQEGNAAHSLEWSVLHSQQWSDF